MMMVERPTETVFNMLQEFKVASIKKGKYVYSSEFEESVKQLNANPPGKFQQLKLGRKAVQIMDSVLLYARSFKSKKALEDMIISYVCLTVHLKRLNLAFPQNDTPELIYGTWYLNDNEPEVQDDY